MKIKNLKVTITALALGGILLGVKAFNNYNEEFNQSCADIRMDLDEIEDNIDEIRGNLNHLKKMIMQQHAYLESLEEDSSQVEKEQTVEEEVEELLEESPEYRKIAEYVSEITEEDIEAFQKEVLDYYEVTSQKDTFRFNPNNISEAKRRIQAYAEAMDSEENKTFETEYHIETTVEDFLVYDYRKEYQESHPEASEAELEEAEKEFKLKASAVYYTKMNLKYLSDETLKALNEKYHFVEESENLVEDIKAYVDSAIIRYKHNPLMRKMVANQGDYIAHGLLDENTNTKRYCAFIGSDSEVVDEVIHGDYGNGEERKVSLGEEGYTYFVVQEAVNLKLGVVSDQNTVFYRIENGEVVSNLPVLPTDQDELCKYLLIELKYQSQHYGMYGPESYDPSEFLIKQVIFGHYNQVYDMLYRTGEITDDTEKAILEELDYHRYVGDAMDFFETVEQVQKVTGNIQKTL